MPVPQFAMRADGSVAMRPDGSFVAGVEGQACCCPLSPVISPTGFTVVIGQVWASINCEFEGGGCWICTGYNSFVIDWKAFGADYTGDVQSAVAFLLDRINTTRFADDYFTPSRLSPEDLNSGWKKRPETTPPYSYGPDYTYTWCAVYSDGVLIDGFAVTAEAGVIYAEYRCPIGDTFPIACGIPIGDDVPRDPAEMAGFENVGSAPQDKCSGSGCECDSGSGSSGTGSGTGPVGTGTGTGGTGTGTGGTGSGTGGTGSGGGTGTGSGSGGTGSGTGSGGGYYYLAPCVDGDPTNFYISKTHRDSHAGFNTINYAGKCYTVSGGLIADADLPGDAFTVTTLDHVGCETCGCRGCVDCSFDVGATADFDATTTDVGSGYSTRIWGTGLTYDADDSGSTVCYFLGTRHYEVRSDTGAIVDSGDITGSFISFDGTNWSGLSSSAVPGFCTSVSYSGPDDGGSNNIDATLTVSNNTGCETA